MISTRRDAITELHGFAITAPMRMDRSAAKELGSAHQALRLLGIPRRRIATTRACERQRKRRTEHCTGIDALAVETADRRASHRRARKAKNFAESDRIRDELLAMGVVLKDSKDGTTWELAR